MCKNPAWSRSALFSIFNYYRVEEIKSKDSMKLVMSCLLGASKDNKEVVEFYENVDKSISIKLKDKYYKPIRGHMTYNELENYINNYTDYGLK
jgi:hypothetical protein